MRVFVNASAVDVDAGSTALDCVKSWQNDEAVAVQQGRRLITDSRGLPIDGQTVAQAGSIYRTVSNRAAPSQE